jgi:hypothetical protein
MWIMVFMRWEWAWTVRRWLYQSLLIRGLLREKCSRYSFEKVGGFTTASFD